MFFFLVLCFFIGSNCYPSVWLDSVWMSAVIVLTLCVASLIIFYSSRNVTQTVERKITMIQFSYSSCKFSCPDLFCEQPFIVWPRETEKDLERKTNVYSLGGGYTCHLYQQALMVLNINSLWRQIWLAPLSVMSVLSYVSQSCTLNSSVSFLGC